MLACKYFTSACFGRDANLHVWIGSHQLIHQDKDDCTLCSSTCDKNNSIDVPLDRMSKMLPVWKVLGMNGTGSIKGPIHSSESTPTIKREQSGGESGEENT